MNTTGKRIREMRTKLNLTLDDVARHLGVGRQAIYKYEQGTVTNIPLENLEKMAALFGTTPGYLAGWSNANYGVRMDLDLFNGGKASLDSPETSLVSSFRALSPRGQELLLERAEELKLLYGKKSESDAAKSV